MEHDLKFWFCLFGALLTAGISTLACAWGDGSAPLSLRVAPPETRSPQDPPASRQSGSLFGGLRHLFDGPRYRSNALFHPGWRVELLSPASVGLDLGGGSSAATDRRFGFALHLSY
jgi:hypothetical protein